MDTHKKPLGMISLLDSKKITVKQKPIYPMDDFFVSYVFKEQRNWNNLRTIINTFLEAYVLKYKRHDLYRVSKQG
jgi:hypothetical protein